MPTYNYSFDHHIEIDGHEVEVTVHYSISGDYRPATLEEPEEQPDLEITGVIMEVEGVGVDLTLVIPADSFIDAASEHNYSFGV